MQDPPPLRPPLPPELSAEPPRSTPRAPRPPRPARPPRPVSELEQQTLPAIESLIKSVGGDPSTFDGRLIVQLIQTSLKLIPDGHDTGQLKLLTAALKEMRHAYRVFNKYRGIPKITIFGSARTPPTHPDYLAARAFSQGMAKHGWMVLTGAGNGIMKAGHEGPDREGIFGLSIRLPFETTANTVIEGDPKLINFRYFFTRKLMFMTHADAVAVFPGGFGTQDELFESLTLVQTGKSNIVPIVLIEGGEGETSKRHPADVKTSKSVGESYWHTWDHYLREHLLKSGWISDEDPGIYHIAASVDDAVEHVQRFYYLYHSSRYVGDVLVLRLKRPLLPEHIEALNEEFNVLVKSGRIEQSKALEGERDHLDLPRIAFAHSRRHYGMVRKLIDRINSFAAMLPESESILSGPPGDAGIDPITSSDLT